MGIRTAAILIVLTATCAFAKGAPDAAALAKLANDDPKKAAGFTKLLLDARKAMALDRQQELAPRVLALVPVKDHVPLPARGLSVLKGLADPKTYAWFSAHHLAYLALLGATATGTYDDLEPALALAVKRDSARHGAYARAMATYAKGIRTVQKPADAIKAYAAVLSACAKHGWAQLALHGGLELSLLHVAAGDAASAQRVMQETFAAVREDTHPAILFGARTMISNRLERDHAELYKAWEDVLSKRLGKYSQGSPAGAGGAGRNRETTPLGKALRAWKKTKPLVHVTRKGNAFQIVYGFGKLPAKTHKRTAGIAHIDEGGLMLAFWQSGVRLQSVSLNNEAVAGANAAPGRWQQFDPLADGETWTLYATGEIRFK